MITDPVSAAPEGSTTDVWHYVCVYGDGNPQPPLGFACCGQPDLTVIEPDPSGMGCPLCDLIHKDGLPCAHSGLDSHRRW